MNSIIIPISNDQKKAINEQHVQNHILIKSAVIKMKTSLNWHSFKTEEPILLSPRKLDSGPPFAFVELFISGDNKI